MGIDDAFEVRTMLDCHVLCLVRGYVQLLEASRKWKGDDTRVHAAQPDAARVCGLDDASLRCISRLDDRHICYSPGIRPMHICPGKIISMLRGHYTSRINRLTPRLGILVDLL